MNRGERLASIDILVHDKDISWSLGDGTDEPKTQSRVEMKLSERRRQTIDLLVGLLLHSTDVEQKATDLEKTLDSEGEKLYATLLTVVGHELFDLLFVKDIRKSVSKALNDLHDGDIDRFRIKLCFTGSHGEWLSRLPWEYSRTPPEDPDFNPKGVFLSHVAELLLSRRLQLKHFRSLTVKSWPVRVLLVCSSPPDAGDDKLEPVEAVRVVEKLEELEREGVVELGRMVEQADPGFRGADYRPQVTWDEFQRFVFAFQPEIIHFIGHGHCADGAGALAFAAESGEVDWVTDDEFARVANRSKALKLAFLQACKSALPDPYVSFSGVARTLAASGLPAVVGMQYRVTSSAANAFAVEFYDALLSRGLPISYAVQAARDELEERGEERHAFGLPVLYLTQDAVLARPPGDPPSVPDRGTSVDRGDVPNVIVMCPRCEAELEGLQQKVCHRCALRLRCPEPDCGQRYADALNDRFCRNCTAPVRQIPYSRDAADEVASVTSGGTTPARAALAVLRGPGGGGA